MATDEERARDERHEAAAARYRDAMAAEEARWNEGYTRLLSDHAERIREISDTYTNELANL